MQLKTILNRVQKHQSFIYTDMELKEQNGQLELNITLRPVDRSAPVAEVNAPVMTHCLSVGLSLSRSGASWCMLSMRCVGLIVLPAASRLNVSLGPMANAR